MASWLVVLGGIALTNEHKLRQIDHVRRSEPIGSGEFYLQFGLLMVAALVAAFIFSIWLAIFWWGIYLIAFMIEKSCAERAVLLRAADKLPLCLGILAARASIYNFMPVYLWSLDLTVFKFGALALVVASTLNSFVHQGKFKSTLAAAGIPNALVFVALAALEYYATGASVAFFGSVVAVGCIIPYYLLTLNVAGDRLLELEAAKQELQRRDAVDSMGKVAAGVAHDFNNILSVMLGSLEIAQHSHSTTEKDKMIDNAIDAVSRASSLTKQMLTLGKNAPLLPEAVDTQEFMKEFEEFAGHVLPAPIKVRIENPKLSFGLYVDRSMLQNSLLNLVINSRNAMSAGGIIVIAHEVVDAPEKFPLESRMNGRCGLITVKDKGPGIPAEHLDKVFEPFFTTNEVGGGSGLGLPMVRGFVEQSSGLVSLTSPDAGGVVVQLFLPLAKQDTSVENSRAIDPVPALKLAEHHRKRVLLVEDSEDFRLLLSRQLEQDGCDIVQFATADAAIDEHHDFNGIDLVVTDYLMPGGKNGIDLLMHVKQRSPGTPVILMSGYADMAATRADLLSSADCFLEKPLSLTKFAEEVAKLILLQRD